MTKNPDSHPFMDARETVAENIEAIRYSLNTCVEQGMIDTDNALYNECLDLLDDAAIVENWDEMEELVEKGKSLEQEVAAWLALRGLTSVSLQWPHRDN